MKIATCNLHFVLSWNQVKREKKKNAQKRRSRACQRKPRLFDWERAPAEFLVDPDPVILQQPPPPSSDRRGIRSAKSGTVWKETLPPAPTCREWFLAEDTFSAALYGRVLLDTAYKSKGYLPPTHGEPLTASLDRQTADLHDNAGKICCISADFIPFSSKIDIRT